ncbi:hypothetical protein [Rathayibacter sp. VKM Ac-2927]|uniref:hypothetical protein n=1 Tax=Rathayibacter sp. VKM Ac-2927 TaxID=2929478 RepID=UPI001FB1A9E2|nr:hypothetical protein [Rathayibacter sp. VKM Ac-2927]MCJ1688606.1 hypothetical protein [Rathayibacter sp. VKM Ac-2927]
MKRTELALGATTLLASVIAAGALMSTAQAQPRAAAEVTSASTAPTASTEQRSSIGDPMPNGEFEAIWGGEAAADIPEPETSATAAVEGTAVESADAAIAIALSDQTSIKVDTSTRAIKTTSEEAYGPEGLLAESSLPPTPNGVSTDELWLVGVTGDITNSYGRVALSLDWMIFVIDARTGLVANTWGNTGTLPDIFG